MTAAVSGATWFRCSGAVTASVDATDVRNGPQGTAAGNSPCPSEEHHAITLSLNGSCWVAGRLFFSAPDGVAPSSRFPRRPKTLGSRAGGGDVRCMQKRANSARLDWRGSSRNFLVGSALAIGAMTAAVSGATWFRCSGAVTASVDATDVRNGPQGTAAGNSTVGRVG